MTRELIIEGQHVDLAPGTDITLEFVSNLTGDLGKINLSHSYTVKLPKTTLNAKILDDPGNPGHESNRARRFLSAEYYRNGISLIGQAQAYLLKASSESYEVALVWNTLEALQALSQNAGTLNDLPDLPMLGWLNGATPDYTRDGTDGAFFAWYESGLGANKYPTVNTGTHPSMGLSSLIQKILDNAGVPFQFSTSAAAQIAGHAILAAPGHAPSRLQEIQSGSSAGAFSITVATVNGQQTSMLSTGNWTNGWDGVRDGNGYLQTGDNDRHRVLINIQAPAGVDLSDCKIIIDGYTTGQYETVVETSETLLEAYFKEGPSGWYMYIDEDINLSGWPKYQIGLRTSRVVSATFSRYNPDLPMLAYNRIHNEINAAKDNRFPLQGNLPNIKQWDFIKACMAQFGLAPIIQDGVLSFYTYDELLTSRNAYDWTSKVDMRTVEPEDMSYTLDSWARDNIIVFQDNPALSFNPNAAIVVEDTTLEESRDLYELPWAASMQSAAQHYKVKDDGTLEDVDIEPRIFAVETGDKGHTLRFKDDMHGSGLIAAHYQTLQEVVRKPVRITANIRLHEIDLAQLDLTRPVYLGQYGQYYAILKIQTSATDLCKVELLQLP